ncbi:MAG: hypothetical protein IBX68_11635 [Dehalococcoidia bacterium]|nr:hypothetical protein [Dehalococcoidia bacterium]
MDNEQGQFDGDLKDCIHHWLINATNFGVCKKCGESKQFCTSWGTIQRSWYTGARKTHLDAPVARS